VTRLLAHRAAPTAVLILATAIWGLAFLVTRSAVTGVPVLPFIALRFATAALCVRLATGARMSRSTGTDLRAGVLLGLAMLAGYALQGEGLRTLPAGKTAFISALYVPLVPLIQMAISRRVPGMRLWIGVALACAGLTLMTGASAGDAAGPPGRGEAFALAGAFAIAAEITLVGRFAARVDPRRLAIAECGVVSVLALVLTWGSGTAWPAPHAAWLACAFGLGGASAFLQISTNWAMRSVPPTRATLIFATEPVWAAGFGALAGETMAPMAILGGGLILAALVVGALPGHAAVAG